MRFYFLLLSLTILLFSYFPYRQAHPLTTYSKLITLQSKAAINNQNPCLSQIINGIPDTPLPDGIIQINFICADGHQSYNYLRLGAIPKQNLDSALKTITQINNLKLPLLTDIRINGVPTTDFNHPLKVNDTIDVHLN